LFDEPQHGFPHGDARQKTADPELAEVSCGYFLDPDLIVHASSIARHMGCMSSPKTVYFAII
jgi:hypothetical protein